MNKYKVFMPCGTIQTIIANKFEINYDLGRLRFEDVNGFPVAIFPQGGWHGVQDMTTPVSKVAV